MKQISFTIPNPMKLLATVMFLVCAILVETDAQVAFDGTPGTMAPPNTLGVYTMTPFQADGRPLFNNVSNAETPLGGNVGFNPALTHYRIGSGWLSWSHGYTGDVYFHSNPNTSVTLSLPIGTRAFYFYAEPNNFANFTVEAVADNGTTSGPIAVNGMAGARYFGFYVTQPGATNLTQITITADPAAGGFAIGEFGIAACNPNYTNHALACNDNVQLSITPDLNVCRASVTLDMILEGTSSAHRGLPCDVQYAILEVKNGNQLVHLSDPLTYLDQETHFDASAYIGRTLTTKVIYYNFNGGILNQCWGSITIEDKAAPVITCEVEYRDPKTGALLQMGDVITIDCTVDPDLIGVPVAQDNCDISPNVNLVNETQTGSNCNVLTITRTFRATDSKGNESAPCLINILVEQPAVTFPDDVTWTCEQYLEFPNIVDASDLHLGILCNADLIDKALYCCQPGLGGDDVVGRAPYQAGVAWWTDAEDLDVNLDVNYDDNIDNPLSDPNTFNCGTNSPETDSNTDVYNLSVQVGCPYTTECIIPGGHLPTIKTVPLYQPFNGGTGNPIRGLEDRDILELTGSGVPNVYGTNCNFSVTYTDQVVEACQGVHPSSGVFKILRNWSVLNWCTGQVITDVQIIKVLDKKAPVITFNDDDDNDGIPDEDEATERYGNDDGYDDQLYSNEFIQGSHNQCGSSGLIDVPEIEDNCSGLAELKVFTPAGQATPFLNSQGEVIGYKIPFPYLSMGVHTITFKATDGCGNQTTVEKRVEVIDGVPPIPICREVTQISLSGDTDGITAVNAAFFDEGSYDNCGPVYFKARRMDNACTGYPDDRSRFNDEIHFCCSDVGDTVNVILRVYDVEPTRGPVTQNYLVDTYHTNDCMIQVLVEDKSRPTCKAPRDVWTTCTDIPANFDLSDTTVLQDLFGHATGVDNCVAHAEELSPIVDVDLCGVGQIRRRFRTRDNSDNLSVGTCQQTVMIMQVHSYEIDIPGDFEDECTDVSSPDTLNYREFGCDLIGVNLLEEEFPASANGECKKIFRKYRIINWCEYDGISDPVIIPRFDLNQDGQIGDGFTPSNPASQYRANYKVISNGDYIYINGISDPISRIGTSTGYYQYEQHLKIFDDTAPELTDTLSGPFCGGDLDEDPCTGEVDLLPQIVETCTDVTITWQLDAFNDRFQTAEFSGTDNLSGRYPLGVHTARFRVSDDCGNTSQIDITFEIIDCKAPTPVCHNGLSIDLMASGMVEIWATDFDASSYDYCHPLKFRINRIVDRNGDGFITADDYVNTVPTTDSIVLRCKDLGLTYVQLWVGEESTDNVNNWDYCVTFIEVQDNLGACDSNRPSNITGTIKNIGGDNVQGVDVSLSGHMQSMVTTGSNGGFAFNGLVRGNDYTVSPSMAGDIRNGVSTFDLALIAKHVLNVASLDSPYKVIAADANNSGSVSTLDLVILRKLILFVSNDLPGNSSWRFVPKDFPFANPMNPWGFPEVKNYNDILGDHIADFVAIKVGDVSGDAIPNLNGSIQNRSYQSKVFFDVKDTEFKAGDEVRVSFTSKELTELMGYQFTMEFDNKVLNLVDIENGVATEENFGLSMVNDGIITTSWNGSTSREEAFSLIFIANSNGTLSDVFKVSSQLTANEAYTTNEDIVEVAVRFNSGFETGNEFALYQNTPNPFRGNTTIGFVLPESTNATVTISDISGKVLKVINGEFAKGYNSIELNSAEFNAFGVLYYQLETATHNATRKLIILE